MVDNGLIPSDLNSFMERPARHEVTVMRPSGPTKINVDIEYNLPEHKPFLGGFKNRVTGEEYHHVAGQTALLPHQRGLDKLIDKFHRACQTQITTSGDAQTAREFGCQTPFFHQYINDEYPTLNAGEYMLAKDELVIREVSALKIQRVTRGLFARQTVAKMRLELEEEKKEMEEQEKKVQAELEHKRMVEIERRRHPRTAADFKVLLDELAAWHWQETQAINEGNHPEEERRKLLQDLLQKETELLHTIDRMKIEAKKQNTEYRNDKDLDTLSKKKLWQLTNGEIIKVRTPNSMRAKELRNLYRALKFEGVTADERIEILLLLKQTVKEFNCQLTQDMITLIDREADLLNRGRSEASLMGLRKRIETLFLQFCQTPEFNPESASLQKVPADVVAAD
ncbi:IQ calmodulin-binding motif family protein [Tritrichomonas foetus]|uniref:IQ calmodulin-binding motif family protein n=1 Tax=Tritrichomonas foetus TaxID=1144522 RepID=A0A1J4KQ49_9EUKA|nr:IQ calmodulin-binding motif family protein [Tritrichomonas foetus]|eukprot:OHT11916.1 IQ calmodulin-binding motif family protein [Tritrichomonas foetus]